MKISGVSTLWDNSLDVSLLISRSGHVFCVTLPLRLPSSSLKPGRIRLSSAGGWGSQWDDIYVKGRCVIGVH